MQDVERVVDEDDQTEEAIPDVFKTKPNLDRKASEPSDSDLHPSKQTPNGVMVTSPGSLSQSSSKAGKVETVLAKDRDIRGEEGDGMWWECAWEGMDGIGGTNKKGRRCFDRVRIWWQDVPLSQITET